MSMQLSPSYPIEKEGNHCECLSFSIRLSHVLDCDRFLYVLDFIFIGGTTPIGFRVRLLTKCLIISTAEDPRFLAKCPVVSTAENHQSPFVLSTHNSAKCPVAHRGTQIP